MRPWIPWAATGVLSVLLIGSNAWWAAALLDRSVTVTHMGDAMHDECGALDQALSIIPVAARGGTRQEVLDAARKPLSSGDRSAEFEKDGAIWVGRIGLHFSDNGKLGKVERAWSPSTCE